MFLCLNDSLIAYESLKSPEKSFINNYQSYILQ